MCAMASEITTLDVVLNHPSTGSHHIDQDTPEFCGFSTGIIFVKQGRMANVYSKIGTDMFMMIHWQAMYSKSVK